MAERGLAAKVIEPAIFRHALGHYPTGVCLVTSLSPNGAPIGMVVGSFTSVSLDPPLVAFLPDKRSTTWPLMSARAQFCINIFAADQETLCRQFSAGSGNKFADIAYAVSPLGLPLVEGALAWIDCSIHAVHEAGDHYIAIGLVASLSVERDERPLVFLRGGYHQISTPVT
jgi:3-hydroxy-9,10-secoandrosta-1,3,5(10)-triene-9,17-dione monooxygenase reductase component